MNITRSSRYNNDKELIFTNDEGERREVMLQRTWAGFGFHGRPHCLIVIGEESFFSDTHFYVLCEVETSENETLHDLLDITRRIRSEYKVTKFIGRLDTNIQETLSKNNKIWYSSGTGNIMVQDVPRIGEEIDTALSDVHMLVRAHEKRLHFFNESGLMSALKSISMYSKIKAEDNPRATALANVVGALLECTHEIVDESMLYPEPTGGF